MVHGPYYYKAVALIPPRPCAIHSPPSRSWARPPPRPLPTAPPSPLPRPSTVFFFSSLFVSLHARAFLHRLAGFDTEIETAGPRPLLRLYCASLYQSCVPAIRPASFPFFHFPFMPVLYARSYSLALASSIPRANVVDRPLCLEKCSPRYRIFDASRPFLQPDSFYRLRQRVENFGIVIQLVA